MSDLNRKVRGIGGSKDLKKVESIKSPSDIIPYFNDLIERLNDKFKRMSLTSNFDCDLIENIVIPAGTTQQIRHRLKVVPNYRIILRHEGNGLVTDDNTIPWDTNYIYLRNNGGSSVTITIAIYKE
jgi:hypothetical protein